MFVAISQVKTLCLPVVISRRIFSLGRREVMVIPAPGCPSHCFPLQRYQPVSAFSYDFWPPEDLGLTQRLAGTEPIYVCTTLERLINILVYDKNNVKSYQSFGTWRKVCFFENLSNLSDEVKKQLTSCTSLLWIQAYRSSSIERKRIILVKLTASFLKLGALWQLNSAFSALVNSQSLNSEPFWKTAGSGRGGPKSGTDSLAVTATL